MENNMMEQIKEDVNIMFDKAYIEGYKEGYIQAKKELTDELSEMANKMLSDLENLPKKDGGVRPYVPREDLF